MKLVTRAQWGARAYRLPNGATQYSGNRRGVKLHYLGTAYSDRSHDKCDDYVRQIQAQHMDGNGWSDIGYSFVVCTHGYVYEGRGLKRRNSANGSTTLNEQDYAVLLMVGSTGLTRPTDAQLHGARDAIEHCRKEGPAGTWLGGHRDGYATTCPGDAVYAWAKKGAPRPGGSTPTAPPQEDDVPTNWNRATDTTKNLGPAEWTVVPAESTDLITGASAYTGSMFLTLTAPAGGTVQGRWFHLRPDGTRWVGPIAERQTTAGSTFADFPHAGSVDPTEKVRFEAVYYPVDENDTAPASITSARLRGLYWK